MLELIGLKLNLANVEKKSDRIPRSVDVRMDLINVFISDDGALGVEFEYHVDYNPECASMLIGGIGYFRGDGESVSKAINEYKKNKKLSPETGAMISNPIGAEVGLNSVFIMRPFGLVPHFVPPPIVLGERTQIQKGAKPVKTKK